MPSQVPPDGQVSFRPWEPGGRATTRSRPSLPGAPSDHRARRRSDAPCSSAGRHLWSRMATRYSQMSLSDPSCTRTTRSRFRSSSSMDRSWSGEPTSVISSVNVAVIGITAHLQHPIVRLSSLVRRGGVENPDRISTLGLVVRYKLRESESFVKFGRLVKSYVSVNYKFFWSGKKHP